MRSLTLTTNSPKGAQYLPASPHRQYGESKSNYQPTQPYPLFF